MLYVLSAIVLIVVAVMLLRFRIRLDLSEEQRLLFVGLGRTGHEHDFTSGTGRVRLFGLNIKSIKPETEKPGAKPKKPKKPKPKKKSTRQRSIVDMLRVVPSVGRALTGYMYSLLRSFIIEKLEGEIEAGFETPDITGQAYGYYQAAVGAVPGIAGRFKYIPDWQGPSFSGAARVSVAIPLYRVFIRTTVLIFKLPLRDLIKLAIGTKKGDQDV